MPDVSEGEAVLNVALFKALGIFALCNPNGPKMFGHNAYRLTYIVIIAIVHCIVAYGLLGFVARDARPANDGGSGGIDDITLFPIIFTYLNAFMCSFKMSIVVYNANRIWDLLDVTRSGFLSSALCAQHVGVLREYRATSIATTNFLARFAGFTLIVWLATPFVSNAFASAGADSSRRYENIYNIPYPVSPDVYNRYYFAFFLLELTLSLFLFSSTIVLNTIVFSCSSAVIAQYEIVVRAFAGLGHGHNGKSDDMLGQRRCPSAVTAR